jgi:hypothetical protein
MGCNCPCHFLEGPDCECEMCHNKHREYEPERSIFQEG